MNCGQTSLTGSEREIEIQDNSSSSCATGLTTGLAIVGGATLGAALMYLLDPDEGPDRRKHVKGLTGSAIASTGSALESGWSKIRDTAGRVYEAAAEGAHSFKDTLSSGADHLTDNRYARGFAKSARGAKDEASDRLGYLMHGKRSSMMPESPLVQALCTASLIGLGAGAMYFFDNREGARRRSVFRDKLLSAFGHMSDKLSKQGRNLMNRTRGLAYEMRSGMSREQVDDKTLTERIRAQIGRYVDNAGAIVVECNEGNVILRGPIMASQLNGLLKATRGVRGVNNVDNQLDVSAMGGAASAESMRGARMRESSRQVGTPLCPPGSSTTSNMSV
jgi:osmotically-inducible protein OsmY